MSFLLLIHHPRWGIPDTTWIQPAKGQSVSSEERNFFIKSLGQTKQPSILSLNQMSLQCLLTVTTGNQGRAPCSPLVQMCTRQEGRCDGNTHTEGPEIESKVCLMQLHPCQCFYGCTLHSTQNRSDDDAVCRQKRGFCCLRNRPQDLDSSVRF